MDNVFTAAKACFVGYDVALELAQFLRFDDAQTTWKAFENHVHYIDDMMFGSPSYGHWQALLDDITHKKRKQEKIVKINQ